MRFFGKKFRSKPPPPEKGDSSAAKTAPGLKAIKDLWQIEKKPPVAPVEGEVVTDIYATSRPNGVPRRRNPPRHKTPEDEEYKPPF